MHIKLNDRQMKTALTLSLSALLVLSGCGTYTGSGAYTGVSIGSVLGSAVGGISGGIRGSSIGTIIGMAGGAAIGGAIGHAREKKRMEDLDQYRREKAERAAQRREQTYYEPQDDVRDDGVYPRQETGYDSGFDATNSGDDRIYDFNGSDYQGSYSAAEPITAAPEASGVDRMAKGLRYEPEIEIRNARFVDDNQDGNISRGELSKVIFEVYNHGPKTLYDVQPTVVEATGNKHIYVSPSVHVEKIAPGKGIRYTALVKADNRLKNGKVRICASVILGNGSGISKVSEFNIPTKSR